MFDLEVIEKRNQVTWEQLAHVEPHLDDLLCQVTSARPSPENNDDFDYEGTWGTFKQPIATLVGYHRRDSCDARLKTNAAYEVAYCKLWHALHD